MKTLNEVITEIKENSTTTKSGKQKKTFSRADYDKMTAALLNEVDYTVETVGIKNGELVTKETKPVKEFRGMMKKVLTDFGVDKQEAEAIMEDYKFSNATGFYPIAAASIVEYCNAGKKFDFPTEKDFKGSLTIEDIGATTKEYQSIRKAGDKGPAEKFKVKTEAHRSLKSSSKPPKWLKEKFTK